MSRSREGGDGQPVVVHILEAMAGGTSRHVIDVVRHTHGVHHEVVLPPTRIGWVTDTTTADAVRAAGAVVHIVDMRRSPSAWQNFVALVRIARLVRRRRPDVVHGHSSIGGVLARLAPFGSGSARVYTPNGIAPGRVPRAIERLLRPATDRFVAVSPSEGEAAVAIGLIDASRLVVIPNGVELDASPPAPVDLRAVLGLAAGVPLVGCIARLVPQKAPEDFVRIAALVAEKRSDAAFVIIGDGPLQQSVDDEVDRAGLGGAWHQINDLPGAAGILDQLDVFVLPSRFEGAPYSPLEAMRAGVPVVLTDCVGSRDVLEDGVSGFMAPVGAVRQMADAVLAVLGSDEVRARIVAGGRARLAERFDVRAQGAATAALYRDLAGSRG